MEEGDNPGTNSPNMPKFQDIIEKNLNHTASSSASVKKYEFDQNPQMTQRQHIQSSKKLEEVNNRLGNFSNIDCQDALAAIGGGNL